MKRNVKREKHLGGMMILRKTFVHPSVSDECRVERAGKNMKKKITVLIRCAMLFALCLPAHAQQAAKIPRIGYLGSTSVSARTEAFRQGLRELGNITGLSILAPELSGKRLELLKEIVPKLSRVAVFGTSTNPDKRAVVERGGTCRKGARSEASIPERTRSQG